jgi:hypothetical protein
MTDSNYSSFANNMNFSNSKILSDISKKFNNGGYSNSSLSNTGINANQFGFNLGDTSTSNSFLKGVFGGKNADGSMSNNWRGTALNVLQSGLGFYLGSQQLDQAEDALAENKRQFNTNYNAQKTLINDQLKWQYQARKDRNAANAGELAQIS